LSRIPVLLLLLIQASGAHADLAHESPVRPDSHAPIGVMADHTHGKGEFMLSYRYMYMDMERNRSATQHRNRGEVLRQFMVSPTEMQTQMVTFVLTGGTTIAITDTTVVQ